MNEALPIEHLLTIEYRNSVPNRFHLLRTSSMSHGTSTCDQFMISNSNQKSVLENKASIPWFNQTKQLL
jgi:hypothetical protein